MRKSGILLHISSLPGKSGIGTFGKEAYIFVDFLKKSGQSLWQILPLGHTGYGNSPYSSFSAFAGNPLFIDIDMLSDIYEAPVNPVFSEDKVNYNKIKEYKMPLLKKIANKFLSDTNSDKNEYFSFQNNNSYWLEDYAFFIALKEYFYEKALSEFDKKIRFKEREANRKFRYKLNNKIEEIKVIQYFFFRQWFSLKKYANDNGIEIIGDIPLYVSEDSSDFWSKSEIFVLNQDKTLKYVAGVPPDSFSKTGQLWGNPVYNWNSLKRNEYKWWIERLKLNNLMFDRTRLDHFRGLSEFWAVKPDEKTAEKGKWLKSGGHDFLNKVFEKIPDLKIIAEDLGIITPDVEKLRDNFKLPGMKILQFAFTSDPENEFLPHNYNKNCVVYTGTHDNDTSLSWYNMLKKKDKNYLKKYTNINKNNISNSLIKIAWSSVAEYAIVPLQDLLNMDTHARMNIPGRKDKNWEWRFTKNELTEQHSSFLKEITETFGRIKE